MYNKMASSLIFLFASGNTFGDSNERSMLMKFKKIAIACVATFCAHAALGQDAGVLPSAMIALDACYQQEGDAHECMRQFEAKHLQAQDDKNIVKRQGDELCIHNTQGESTCFNDHPLKDAKHERDYYIGQLPNWPEISVIYTIGKQSLSYTFVSSVNGEIVYEQSEPDEMVGMAVSPNGKYIAIANQSPYEVQVGGIAWILEVNDQKRWEYVWSEWESDDDTTIDATREGLSAPRWISDEQVMFTGIKANQNDQIYKTGTMLVVTKEGTGWEKRVEKAKKKK